MAWFKIDDHLYSHPKWMALPKPGSNADVVLSQYYTGVGPGC